MRILFAGTGEIAKPTLQALIKSRYDIALLTAPDSRKGRKRAFVADILKLEAEKADIPLFQPEKLNRKARDEIREFNAELLVSFSYSKIFGPRFLALFPKGGINVHPSALPRFRGPSPLTAALLAGDEKATVSIQNLALGMDEGDILSDLTFPIETRETNESLVQKVAVKTPSLLLETLANIETNSQTAKPQVGEPSYTSLVAKEDGKIEWSDSANEIERQIRAYTPWPTSYTFFNGTALAIKEASLYNEEHSLSGTPGKVLGFIKKKGILIETGRGILLVEKLQLQGKKPLDCHNFLNGQPHLIGEILP